MAYDAPPQRAAQLSNQGLDADVHALLPERILSYGQTDQTNMAEQAAAQHNSYIVVLSSRTAAQVWPSAAWKTESARTSRWVGETSTAPSASSVGSALQGPLSYEEACCGYSQRTRQRRAQALHHQHVSGCHIAGVKHLCNVAVQLVGFVCCWLSARKTQVFLYWWLLLVSAASELAAGAMLLQTGCWHC